MQDFEYQIARLELRGSDVLVVKVHGQLSMELRERIATYAKMAVGDHKVLVIDEKIDLSVLTAEEIAQRVV
jgi:hypothetical protein